MTKKWNELTRAELIGVYKRMSGLQIADTYGVHHNTVYERFKVLGIKAHPSRKFSPPKKEMAELYVRMSMSEMAKHYGVGETVIFKRLKEYGIGGISRSQRLSGKPKSLSHRLAMSRSAIDSGVRAGSKNGNWKGGISSAGKRARSKAAYHQWKAAVFANADWKCEGCGAEHSSICHHCGHRIILHAHHIKEFSDFPELRYEPKNGMALCERCHGSEHHKKMR